MVVRPAARNRFKYFSILMATSQSSTVDRELMSGVLGSIKLCGLHRLEGKNMSFTM